MSISNAPARLVSPEPVPRPESVDGEWLEAMMHRAGYSVDIAGVSVQSIGTGQIGDTARLTITYRNGSVPGPDTLVGKFSSTDPTSLQVAAAWSLYEREVRFYDELATSARITTPTYFGAQLDDAGDFALLLEDLAPAAPGDQFKGLKPDQAVRAVQEAARLHAAFWDQGESAALQWLDSGPLAQPFYAPDIFRSTWPGFFDRYHDQLTHEQRTVCDALAEGYDVYNAPRPRPRCVTHNDFRPDNMLLDDSRLFVVDWQSVALGTNAVDIAYMVGGAFDSDARQTVEPALLAAYHDELLRQGVTGYLRDELDAEYRHFTFAGINVAVGAAMLVQRTERGDRMFLTMLDRHVSHVVDNDALSLLRT